MPWQKGQSGHPGGQEKHKFFRAALRDVLTYERAKKIAEAVVRKAEAGDLFAASMCADRLDGKPKQEVDIHDERSSGLAERFTQLLSEGHRRIDPGRESGNSRVN